MNFVLFWNKLEMFKQVYWIQKDLTILLSIFEENAAKTF